MKTPLSRRRFLKTSTLAAGASLSTSQLLESVSAHKPSAGESWPIAAPNEVSLRLLDGEALPVDSGVSFGVPWPKGSIKRDATFSLSSEGKQLPLPDVLTRDRTTGNEGADARYILAEQSGPRLAAYAYAHTKSPAFAQKAIEELLKRGGGYANSKLLTGPDVLNPAEEALEVNTNEAAQTGLTTIQILELCKDQLPTAAPVRVPRERRPAGE